MEPNQTIITCKAHKKKVLLLCKNSTCIEDRLLCIICLNENAHNSHNCDLTEFSSSQERI